MTQRAVCHRLGQDSVARSTLLWRTRRRNTTSTHSFFLQQWTIHETSTQCPFGTPRPFPPRYQQPRMCRGHRHCDYAHRFPQFQWFVILSRILPKPENSTQTIAVPSTHLRMLVAWRKHPRYSEWVSGSHHIGVPSSGRWGNTLQTTILLSVITTDHDHEFCEETPVQIRSDMFCVFTVSRESTSDNLAHACARIHTSLDFSLW